MMSLMQGRAPQNAGPEPRAKRQRPAYLSSEVLSRAVADGESRLAERIEKMRGECRR